MTECPACGASEWTHSLDVADMYDDISYEVQRCSGCGCGRTVLDETSWVELAARHAVDGRRDASERFAPSVELGLRMLRRRRARMIVESQRRSGGAILEIGCGRGELLSELRDAGHRVAGTELSPEIARAALAKGLEVETAPLTPERFPAASFETVVLWHVIEHVVEPLNLLQMCSRWLVEGGAVVVAAPNIDSWQARWSRERWLHLDVPRHRWHFSIDSLSRLAQRTGFRVESVQGFSLEYGPFGWVETVAHRALGDHTLFTRLLRTPRAHDALRLLPWGALLAGVGVVSPALEALASACRAGGAPVMVWRKSS
ncbi:MAG: class I SAM-dependent methyltransferase [Myxococcota bacterium]